MFNCVSFAALGAVDVCDDLRVLVKMLGTSELEERLPLNLAALLKVALDAFANNPGNKKSSSLSLNVGTVRNRLAWEPMFVRSFASTGSCQCSDKA
jgi:hypothetical protein